MDLSFIIPVRIDSRERLRNLQIVIEDLSLLHCKITVWEADESSRINLSCYSLVEHIFSIDSNPIFHRTKYLNYMLEHTQTSIVGVWDTDVIIPHDQIKEAVRKVKSRECIFCTPFNGNMVDLNAEESKLYTQHNKKGIPTSVYTKVNPYKRPVWGGAFVVNRKTYIACGGENEHFYGWGPEDQERVRRLEILGYPPLRTHGKLYHLWHPRGINSTYGKAQRAETNRRELIKICNMDREHIIRYLTRGIQQYSKHS